MPKTTRMSDKDLAFVRRYCFGGTFPASDERCQYAKAKLLGDSPQNPTGDSDFIRADAIFLCRYPDEKMPTHEAPLISELDQCPYTERRTKIDGE